MSLVLTARLLTSLQLIQIPPTHGQIALVLVHAVSETRHLALAHLRRLVGLVLRVLAVARLGEGLVGGGGGLLAAAAEPAADSVADGGAYCDAAVSHQTVSSYSFARPAPMAFLFDDTSISGIRSITYAAVLAICPNKPGPWLPACC